MSSLIIPQVKEFIIKGLEEDPEAYFLDASIAEVQRLDRAIERGHSLEQQKRFERHKELFVQDQILARKNLHFPQKYQSLEEEEIDVECPVCSEKMNAFWDWEADYDVSDGEAYISGAFPDPKVLHCPNCNYFVEGSDIGTYIPDGLEIEIDPRDYEDD